MWKVEKLPKIPIIIITKRENSPSDKNINKNKNMKTFNSTFDCFKGGGG